MIASALISILTSCAWEWVSRNESETRRISYVEGLNARLYRIKIAENGVQARKGEVYMEITTRNVGKCKVLECSGPITLGPATAALREAIRESIKDGTRKVVLDLGEVPYIDSSGIGELISGFVHVKNQGGSLPLLNLTKKINQLLAIAKLLTIFDVFEDEGKALEGC